MLPWAGQSRESHYHAALCKKDAVLIHLQYLLSNAMVRAQTTCPLEILYYDNADLLVLYLDITSKSMLKVCASLV
jgi:hypothetical protein